MWPSDTQISLYSYPVWQRFSYIPLRIARRLQKAHANSGDSDQADLRWSHKSYCRFCRALAHLWFSNGQRHAKHCLRTCAKCADSDHPEHAQSLIRVFALHSYILQCPMILLGDSEGPDQPARMRRLIWAFAVRICPKRFSHGAAQLLTWLGSFMIWVVSHTLLHIRFIVRVCPVDISTYFRLLLEFQGVFSNSKR